MTENIFLRTVRMGIMSTTFALLAFTLLTFGIASAQTTNHAKSSAIVSGNGMVHISDNQVGMAVFTPDKITIRLGSSLTLINSTKVTQTVVSNSVVVVKLAPGAKATITELKPGLLQFILLSNTSATLNITVTFGL